MGFYTQAQIIAMHSAVLAQAAIDTTLAAALAIGDETKGADWLNAPSTFVVWRSSTPVSDIQAAIVGANFTPVNPVAGAGQDAANWMIACQGKQMNLQLVLGTTGYVATINANTRAWLFDALTAVPSGKNVSNVMDGSTGNVGLAAVKTIIQRFATNAEHIFATGTGTAATPGDLNFEHTIQYAEMPYIMQRFPQP
jgi:hypothetical protein